MDTYILQKDLPYIKAGTQYIRAEYLNDKCSYVPNKTGMKHERFAIHADYIENNPEWFKKEEPKQGSEFDKCIQSPYYFMTTYWTVNGMPFTTPMSEEEFNKHIKDLQNPTPTNVKEQPLPIKVNDIFFYNHNESPYEKIYHSIAVKFNHDIPESKINPLKAAIERCLNGKEEGKEPNQIPEWIQPFVHDMVKTVYQNELMGAMHKAFYAAMEMDYTELPEKPIRHKYPTFADYYQSLKK